MVSPSFLLEESPWRSRYTITALSYSACVLAPTGVFSYLHYPDWSWMYLLNPVHLPSVVVLAGIFTFYPIVSMLGFHFAKVALRFGGHSKAFMVFMLGLVGCASVIAGLTNRILIVGYYEDFYHGGEMVPLIQTPLFWEQVIFGLIVLASLSVTIFMLRKHERLYQEYT